MPVSVRTVATPAEAAATLASDRGARYIAGGTLVMRALNEGEVGITTLVRLADHALARIDARGSRIALGAEVTIHAGGTVQRRYITPAHGYLSQCHPSAYFGLGRASTIERVTVRWPQRNGKVQEWQNLSAGATYHLIEGSSEVVRLGW